MTMLVIDRYMFTCIQRDYRIICFLFLIGIVASVVLFFLREDIGNDAPTEEMKTVRAVHRLVMLMTAILAILAFVFPQCPVEYYFVRGIDAEALKRQYDKVEESVKGDSSMKSLPLQKVGIEYLDTISASPVLTRENIQLDTVDTIPAPIPKNTQLPDK